jgi:hypothetical protein
MVLLKWTVEFPGYSWAKVYHRVKKVEITLELPEYQDYT